MTNEELTVRVQVLEERLAKIAGALIVLVEAVDNGVEKRRQSQSASCWRRASAAMCLKARNHYAGRTVMSSSFSSFCGRRGVGGLRAVHRTSRNATTASSATNIGIMPSFL